MLFYTVKSAEASFALDRLYFLSKLILVGVAFAVCSDRQGEQNKRLQASLMPLGYFKMQDHKANKCGPALYMALCKSR